MIIKITWDFSETEYSDIGHKLAAESLSLPQTIDAEDIFLDEESELSEEDIKDYLYETYCFEVKKVKVIEE